MSRPTPMIGTTAGWRQRKMVAEMSREAAQADRHDPHKAAIRAVRSELIALGQVSDLARREADKLHEPVPPPHGAGGLIHPTRAARIARLMREEGWSAHAHEPVSDVETRANIMDRLTAETRQRLTDAEAVLASFEENHEAVEPVVAEPTRRGPDRPVKRPRGEDLSQVLADD